MKNLLLGFILATLVSITVYLIFLDNPKDGSTIQMKKLSSTVGVDEKNISIFRDSILGILETNDSENDALIDDLIFARKSATENDYLVENIEPKIGRITINNGGVFENKQRESEFDEEIDEEKNYQIIFNLIGQSGRVNCEKIQEITGKLKILEVQLHLYNFPEKYYTLFSCIDWKNIEKSNFITKLHGPVLPYGFSLDAILSRLQKAIPVDVKINTFSIDIVGIPDIFFVLTKMGEEALKNFPAEKMYTDHILLNTLPEAPGNGKKGKEIIEDFFNGTVAPYLEMNNVGSKTPGEIQIFGF